MRGNYSNKFYLNKWNCESKHLCLGLLPVRTNSHLHMAYQSCKRQRPIRDLLTYRQTHHRIHCTSPHELLHGNLPQ